MPTRTINLKMILGKKQGTAELRRALWITHREINNAVARIERTLLLCRGASYRTLGPDGTEVAIPESEVVEQALNMARQAQKRNGKEGKGSSEEVLQALRRLYEQIVPSCRLDDKGNPLKGDAQTIGNSYAGPLFDPDTCRIEHSKKKDRCGPFAETAGKMLDDLPDWMEEVGKDLFDKNNKISYFKCKNAEGAESFYRVNIEKASGWYESDPIQEMISNNKAFNKDGWKKKKENSDPTWAADFARKQMELVQDPRIAIRRKLWEHLGLLPLSDLFFDKERVGNLWNRLAMRLAVAHMLSWESWNHSTKKAHDEARAKVHTLREEYKNHEDQFRNLREYEAARHAELKRVAFADDDRPFRIGPRAMRAWDRVREEWSRKGDSYEARRQTLRDLQTKLRGKFGDPDLFLWLAADGREHLWQAADIVTPFVKLNVAERILTKRKSYSLMTFADARFHPRWAMFEAPGGSNLRNYMLEDQEGKILLRLPLLREDDNGCLSETTYSIRLAASGQLSHFKIQPIAYRSSNKKKATTIVKYRSSHQDLEGIFKGAEILFDRDCLARPERDDKAIANDEHGPVWVKLSLNVRSNPAEVKWIKDYDIPVTVTENNSGETRDVPSRWLEDKTEVAIPPEVYHFNTALSNTSKHGDKLKPGLRVLSVDLGLRTFASCSVFELVKGKPANGLSFPAADDRGNDDPEKLWARHERSFKLCVPGESPTKREKKARTTAIAEIRSIRKDIGRLKDILRLGVIEDNGKRDERITALNQSFDDALTVSAFDRSLIEPLNDARFRSTPELWQQHCQVIYDNAEMQVAKRFSEWRRRTRRKSTSWKDWHERRAYHGGKSIWMLEYLEAVRKLILSWNLRGRSYGEVNRQDKKAYGTVAARLLKHIGKLKEDRVKAGADLLVQAARGYIPQKDGAGWQKRFEPCRVILFEDLARYRFRVDRPRRENSQLMKWNHREILKETAMQAELYGMVTETTAAGFTSRYLASAGAPGIRCRYLTDNDFENGAPKTYVVMELDWMLGNNKGKDFVEKQNALRDMVKPTMWVPWSGGEQFVTVSADKKGAHFIHADINAAQNLQRRFWGRCGEAFRISCQAVSVDGVQCYRMDDKPGARLLGALQQLEHGDGEFLLKDESGNESYVMVQSGRRKTKARDLHEDSSIDAEIEEALVEFEEDSSGGRATLFRDPSGILFNAGYWIPSKRYWSIVRGTAWKAMRQKIGRRN